MTDPQEIRDRFNELFVGIGPKLANKINTENKEVFSAYITRRIATSFTFTFINQDEVKMCISSLKKNEILWHRWNLGKILKISQPSSD